MRIKYLVLTIFGFFSIWNANAKMEDWQNPEVIERGRMPMSATFVTEQQKTLTLNGTWKFKWNETIEGRQRDFHAVNFDDSLWGTMPVPGMWELNGYGDPVYLNVGYAWRGHYKNNPPFPPVEHNYVGQYRRNFSIDKSWDGKQICLNIGSATSNVRVWINGKEVGYSEDSKLEARFDITKYVKVGDNLIALEIFRWCDGTYLEDQDFWRLSGIARGVYVYTREKERIENVHISASMYGDLKINTELTTGVAEILNEVIDDKGNVLISSSVKKNSRKAKEISAYYKIDSPKLWSAEIPVLYTLLVKAKDKRGNIIESTAIPFGFRTVEVKNAQLLVNGKPVLIKGADRHEMNAYKGYVVSEKDMINDIRIMKELNINAVRTCHYPDDPKWLALCDKYGLYVVDEANVESHGMGYGKESLAHSKEFRKAHLSRNQRMVQRDVNHPSVIVWSMGNEAGNGENFYACYDWIKSYDDTRPVQYERALLYDEQKSERNTDIYCPMYQTPESIESYLKHADKPLIQCEYAHAMGNSMGNFKEYWDLVRKYPSNQGGFIWDFVDQALVKKVNAEKGGADFVYAFGGDYNDYEPSDGSFNCNGIIASDRTWHPHAYEVRYQHRSILTSGVGDLQSKDYNSVKIYNENFFINLSNYRLHWTVEVDGKTVVSGVVNNLDIEPQEERIVKLDFSKEEILNICQGKDVFLTVRYLLKREDGLLPAGTEVAYDQILLQEASQRLAAAGSASLNKEILPQFDPLKNRFYGSFVYDGTTGHNVSAWSVTFDRNSGAIASYMLDGKELVKEPLLPNFNRAVIENDMGANLHYKFALWRNPNFVPSSFDVVRNEDNYEVNVKYHIGESAIVLMRYNIYADGAIVVLESMKDAGKLSDAPYLFRFGMSFAMPGDFSLIDFYGKGPWENYWDRNSSALVGRYVQSVNEQYHYGYVRSQESGTKTGLRYFKVLNGNGLGFEITSDSKFSASALPFSIKDLDVAARLNDSPERTHNNQRGVSFHSLELKAIAHENDRSNGSTFVNFDLVQMGLGGVDSWGRLPLRKYMLPPCEREFRFVLRPVNN